ncbi:MAG: hypothetical protein IJ642_10145 [Oscillospiraceae bacterium]|nr:hypothetical protein [Oscillospiraceae bacterium]
MICPYCLQGVVLNARIIRTDEKIKICDECDTIWKESETVSEQTGVSSASFMKQRDCSVSWREFEILKS